MIFIARQRQEKNKIRPLSTLPKHLTVSRYGLWKIIAKSGCPARFLVMVRQFHDGMIARVQNNRELWTVSCNKRNQARLGTGTGISPPCLQMLFRAMMMAFQSDTRCSTLERCRSIQRCRQMCKMSFCMPLTCQRMPQQRVRCKRLWLELQKSRWIGNDKEPIQSNSTYFPRHHTEKEHKISRRHKVKQHKRKAKSSDLSQQMSTRLS